METIWFCLVAIMIAAYVVLDGYDLGAGIVQPLVAKNDAEKRLVIRTIGPFWDGNEVWLLAAGGTLYFAFPALYASGFSGFYLPLMVVLWLLILRGISVEFRNHVDSPVWRPLWDAGFVFSSTLLAVFFGAALGNVVRGVPLDARGYFFAPLWTNFGVSGDVGILDWYTIPVGVTALLALAVHGALWVALKTSGEVNQRARRVASLGWWGLAMFTILITLLTFMIQPQVPASFAARPWGYIFPALALAGLAGARLYLARGDDARAFFSSCGYLIGMLTSVVFGLYPLVLPATGGGFALTVYNAKAPDYGLRIGLVWWVIGMALALSYFVYVNRHFAGKVDAGREGY